MNCWWNGGAYPSSFSAVGSSARCILGERGGAGKGGIISQREGIRGEGVVYVYIM